MATLQEQLSYQRQGIMLLENQYDAWFQANAVLEGATKSSESAAIRTELYPIIKKALDNKENQKAYKVNIDKHMASQINAYTSLGPSVRPILSLATQNTLLSLMGLTEAQVKETLKHMKQGKSKLKNANNPFATPYYIAITMSLRYFLLAKNEEQIRNAILYVVTNVYQSVFYKYYRYPPNETVMAYTIANLSQRFKIKKMGTILNALVDITTTCYETHKDRLIQFDDMNVLGFINDSYSRINSFMRKLSNEYYENYKQGNYLQSEHDDYSDEHYYEADNDSFAIDRITNKVLTNLVINGPDRKLVELAARNSQVSVNMLQTSVLTLVSEDHRDDIREMIECLIGLYLGKDNPDGRFEDLGSNKFYVYCIKVYRQSNTTNTNIIKIKAILDRWVKELDLKKKVGSPGTVGNYRKAIFIFFVFTIEKLC